jgi:hypothetical protein
MVDTPQPLVPGFSRRGLLKGSVAVGLGAFGLTVASSALAPGIARAGISLVDAQADNYAPVQDINAQDGWRYCKQCRSLYYAGDSRPCAGSVLGSADHTSASTTDYLVPNGNGYANGNWPVSQDPNGNSLIQTPWRWCDKCSLLFYGPGMATSWCLGTGNAHVDSGSGVYSMFNGTWYSGTFPLQPGWRYCSNCKVLYWGGAWKGSYCVYQTLVTGPNVNNGNNGYGHASGNTVYYVFMNN